MVRRRRRRGPRRPSVDSDPSAPALGDPPLSFDLGRPPRCLSSGDSRCIAAASSVSWTSRCSAPINAQALMLELELFATVTLTYVRQTLTREHSWKSRIYKEVVLEV